VLTPDKIIEIFVKVDDFCKEFEAGIAKHQLDAGNYKLRDRKASLSDREIITIQLPAQLIVDIAMVAMLTAACLLELKTLKNAG